MDARTRGLISGWLGLSLNGWQVESYIDSGKSAHVFKGSKGGTTAAIKIFDPEIIARFGEQDEVERIDRERELIGTSHENLVSIFDGGHSKDHDLFFVVMEFIDAPNLARALPEVPPQSIPQIICQLASAAKFLHDRGIVHRDIKPDNVAIMPDYQKVILLDLGVIRPFEETGGSALTDREKKVFVGTTQYSSPEYLLRREEKGAEGALSLTFYQLGAVLYDLLMKRRIFADQVDPYARLVQAVVSETPQIEAAGKPPQLVSLARNCLVKPPELRRKLVSWEDFCPPSHVDATAVAKERIRKRRILAMAGGLGEGTEQGPDQTRKRSELLTRLLSNLEDNIREECKSGDLPPRSVEVSPVADGATGTIKVQFNPAPRSGLVVAVTIGLNLEVLDTDAQAVTLRCTAVANGDLKLDLDNPRNETAIFTGVYDEATIRSSVGRALFPIMAEAMELPADSGTVALSIDLAVGESPK